VFRNDESPSDFIDIELGEFELGTQSTIQIRQLESLPYKIDDKSSEKEPLLKPEETDGIFSLCPDEVLLAIISQMSVKNMITLSKTNRHFHNIINEYLLNNNTRDIRIYRIGLFKHQQSELNDEIDEANESKIKAKHVMGLLGLGTPLTALSSRALRSTFGSHHYASRDEKILVAIFFIVTVAILLAGLISLLYNIKLNFGIDSATKKIDQFEDKIRYEATAIRNPSALKLLK
jgi:hypothetical protein